ncbi:MAG TPA: translation initiation factor IF-2 [Phnomibacter sp.]|nr:translation initiation factor IF-2 [Phnomibacter sp.]
MSDQKLPRLLAAAKEFNIGQDTLVEFLAAKGFSRDDLKPTVKLSSDMYLALQKEFASDKVAKAKSDMIDLPKGATGEGRKKKEDEDISFGKEVKKPAEAAPVVVEAPVEQPAPAPVPEPAPVVEAVAPPPPPPPPPVVEAPVAEAPPAPVVVEKQPEAPAPEVVETAPSNNDTIKVVAPEIEGPKILGTIDLSAIDSSTRPKKSAKQPEPPAPKAPEAKPVETPAPPAPEPVVVAKQEEPAPVAEPAKEEEKVIENIQAERLSGPKIIGKIELPVKNDTRPKLDLDAAKRKRKRIPIQGKESDTRKPGDNNRGPNTGPNQGGNQQRPGGQGRPGERRIGPPTRPGHGPAPRREERVIDEKAIQEKLKETQARLAGGGGNKAGKNRQKLRRDKRREMAEMQGNESESNLLEVTEFISASELASLMDVTPTEVVGKCFSLGLMVSINQRLDAEVIELVASEFGFDVKFVDLEDHNDDEDEDDVDAEEDLQSRSPIVTIMGHVDHGKTSLLDYIRNANVVSGEAGGITQHIGAYEVKTASGKKITFLDTPGHEAFTAMRARGAKVTDIAVIVVAADDAVMPQTREAISHAQAANVPMIFAINKMDKDGANPQKIYEQLSQMNLLVEDWGGKFQSQEISAKKGMNIDLLLEKILLEAEMLNLKANPEREASGTIIEATLDKGRGYVTTVLVLNGTLKQGDVVVSGQYFGRVKAMFNERNAKAEKAGPSAPALLLGLNGAPQAGEKFKVYEDESEAKQAAYRRGQLMREQGMRAKKHITLDEIGRRLALGNFKELNVIIKGDVDGSVEALSDSLEKLSTQEIVVRVLLKGVGAVSENDVTLANASDAIIIGFNVRPNQQASRLAESEGIEIKQYSVIYNAINDVKAAMEGLLEPKIEEKEVATVEIREVFKFDKATVAGCYVTQGKIRRDAKIRLYRDGVLIYPRGEGGGFAELGSLKRYKDDVKDVLNGTECGLTIKNFTDYQVGDNVVAFEQEEVKRTL